MSHIQRYYPEDLDPNYPIELFGKLLSFLNEGKKTIILLNENYSYNSFFEFSEVNKKDFINELIITHGISNSILLRNVRLWTQGDPKITYSTFSLKFSTAKEKKEFIYYRNYLVGINKNTRFKNR